MPAAYPSFATPDQYAELTGIDPPPAGIQDLLDASSAAIRRYCGWHISPVVTEELIVDGTGGSVISLPTLRLLDLTALTETWNWQTSYIWASDQIEWSRDGNLRKPGGAGWTTAFRGISATIKHGFETADCGDLTQLCITMSARAAASPFGVTTQAVGQVSIRMSSGSASSSAGGVSIYDDQAAALDAYRVFGRA